MGPHREQDPLDGLQQQRDFLRMLTEVFSAEQTQFKQLVDDNKLAATSEAHREMCCEVTVGR